MKLSVMLSWIGVRPRVFGGFALVLSFLVLLAGFAIVQVEQIGGTGAVEKFIRTWNVSDKEAATKAIAGVGKLADQVEQQFGKLRAIADGAGPVRTELETYRASFAAATEAVDRLRAATTKTDALGASAALGVGAIQVALANRSDSERLVNPMRLAGMVDAVRITVMRYGATLATADGDDAKLALGYAQLAIADTEAEITVAGSAGDAKLKSMVTALKTAITADTAALDEVIKVAADLRTRQSDLMKASAAIDQQVNRINQKLGTVRAEQGEKTAASVQQTQQTVIATASGALVVGLVLAWLIGSSVSGPIRSMTDRMQSLAAGELEEAIPGGESRDEIGRMARAVEVFRENALAVRRMELEASAQRETTEACRVSSPGSAAAPRRWAAAPRNWRASPNAVAGLRKPSRPAPNRRR